MLVFVLNVLLFVIVCWMRQLKTGLNNELFIILSSFELSHLTNDKK